MGKKRFFNIKKYGKMRPDKKRSAPSLAATLAVAYVAFTIVALLIFGGLLFFFYFQSHQALISDNQRYIARDAAGTVSGFIREKTGLLTALLRMENPLDLPPEKRNQYLEALLGIEPSFRGMVLLDAQNRVTAQASRLSTQVSKRFTGRLEEKPLVRETQKGSYISPVFIDPDTSEPLVILAVPVTDIFRDYRGYLTAELNLKFMWELVDRLDVRVNGRVYVVDRRGNLIAYGDTTRVLRAENVSQVKAVRNFLDAPSNSGDGYVEIYEGITGRTVVGTYSSLGTPDWAVVVEVFRDEAYRAVLRNVFLSLAMFLGFSILAGLLGILIARRLTSPLVHLTETAAQIAAGSGSVTAAIRGPREVEGLASAFNSMTSQLLQSHANLAEQLVETRQSREALRESEERLRSIIYNANEIIYTLSPEGVFTFVSPAWTRLLGYPVEEITGTHFSRYVHPDDLHLCKAFLDKVLSTGQPQRDVAYRVRHQDGSWRWHTSAGSAVLDASGRPHYYVGIAQDITWNRQAEEEKAKLEQQLLQAQKMELIGRLAGGVAHDFNNMLNVILGYAELIKLDTPADDPLTKKIDEIKRAACHAGEITRQLLAFSRKQIISPVSLDLNTLLKENKETLARLIGEDIQLLVVPAKDIWKVTLDPSQVSQIVYNLAINARDAMPEGGKLTIETANVKLDEGYCREHPGFSQGQFVRLAVSDNGIGMDRETQSHLFEPFFTTKEVGRGTGLGLATVYGIVKQNGGFINLYSEPGLGTAFHIYFIRDTEGKPRYRKKAEEQPILSGAGPIMLVEDEDLVRSITTMELEKLGYNVTALKTPAEALSVCENSDAPFILLITDIVMPGMNGIELKERITSFQPGIKVLFMSGYTANTIVHHGVLDKGVHFIQKPFSLKELAQKVHEAIEG